MEPNLMQSAEQAYDAYAPQLYRVAYALLQSRESAEDAVQDAFARYLAHNGSFRDGEHQKAWLIRVTVNACKDLLKSFFRSPDRPAADGPGGNSPADPGHVHDRNQRTHRI